MNINNDNWTSSHFYSEPYQSTHKSLDEALTVLNEKYGHWDLQDSDAKVHGDGCSSCAAH